MAKVAQVAGACLKAIILKAVAILIVALTASAASSQNAEPDAPTCTDDAMVVFDASGSMSGMLRTGVRVSRIDQVREALEIVLPQIERHRKLGLIVYGPQIGPRNADPIAQCANIDLVFTPKPNAARYIIDEVNALVPSGVTPLTDAIVKAAEVLNYREQPATVVLFTDGQETCGGQPCQTVIKMLGQARALRIHVINYAIRDPYGILKRFGTRCIADQSGGEYVPAATLDELVAAFRKVLGCPLVTQLNTAATPAASPGNTLLPDITRGRISQSFPGGTNRSLRRQ
ncbi:MAG: VWA domain-containing protein [Alphaproteobacteria bacterium]|nr:VWA domain-containing protein [Alphaproteobacteria bacterium]